MAARWPDLREQQIVRSIGNQTEERVRHKSATIMDELLLRRRRVTIYNILPRIFQGAVLGERHNEDFGPPSRWHWGL